MFIELHLIQNFAPSCLNRDDTNTPKECQFGGVRRARLSSQSIKRSIRQHPLFRLGVADRVGVRSKLFAHRIADGLVARGRSADLALPLTLTALAKAGYQLDGDKATVLLHLSPGEIRRYIEFLDLHWDALASLPPDDPKPAKGKKAKDATPMLTVALKSLGSPTTEAADIALFGRMVTSPQNMTIDAACQVAQAISTHEVQVETDFFTAVDDLQPKDDAGAGMMGFIEFNSACFYRYAVVDTDQLARNLGGDTASAAEATLAFVRAAIAAIPSGKQTSMAAHNPPSYIMVRARRGGQPWALTNAFERPVRPRGPQADLVGESIRALLQHDEALRGVYGEDGIALTAAVSTHPDHRGGTLATVLDSLRGALA